MKGVGNKRANTHFEKSEFEVLSEFTVWDVGCGCVMWGVDKVCRCENRIFPKIFEKNFRKFRENFRKMCGDPKTGNRYCEMRNQHFDEWPPGE